MDDNKKFWGKIAKIYERFIRRKKSSQTIYSEMETEICKQLDKRMNVLELAAGPAMLAHQISLNCKSLIVTDFSAEMLEQAKKKHLPDNVSFAIADATNLDYQDEFFDAVVIANALHIMPDPMKAIEEIKRVLKKDGILIAPTFTRETMKSNIIEKLMESIGFRTYHRWDHCSYIEFLKAQGLSIYLEKIIKGHIFPISFLICKLK